MRKFFVLFMGVLALAACNRSPEYYFKRANISVSRGREMQAIQEYNKAILLKRNFPEALTARGMIYEHMGDRQKAEQDYRHAINAKKDYIPAYNNLAALLMDQGNFKEAASYLEEALNINRDYPYAILNRGLCYYKLGKFRAAKADLTRALKMNPKFEMAYYHRALISKREGNTVFFSTHNISDMESVTDYAIIMAHGKVVEEGFVEDLKEKYSYVRGELSDYEAVKPYLFTSSESKYGFEGMVLASEADKLTGFDLQTEVPTLFQISVAVMKNNSRVKM